MKKRLPDQVYLAVRAAVEGHDEAPSSGLARELYALLKGNETSAVVEQAYNIFSYQFKRETLESLLLAETTSKEIENVVGIEAVVVNAYRELFFDTSVFENALDRLQYAGDYTKSKYGKEVKQLAVNLGKEVLKVRFSQSTYSVSPDEAKSAIRATAYMMAQLARANPADSDVSREAQKWANICLKAADSKQDAHAEDATSMRIELEKHEVSVNEETSGIPADEILH